RRIEPDRERRRRRLARIETPQAPQRLTEALADEVVQGRGEGGPRGGMLRSHLGEPRLGGLEIEGILRQVTGKLGERGEDGLERLAVVGRWIGLPPSLHA